MKKFFKKATALVLAASMILASTSFAFGLTPPPPSQPEYVQLRNLVESRGGIAEWDSENARIIITYSGDVFIFRMSSDNAYLNNEAFNLYFRITTNNDRAYISSADAARLFDAIAAATDEATIDEIEAGEFAVTKATAAAVVAQLMEQFNIPGVTVALVDAETGYTWTQGFGYADTINRVPVDETTIFQIASTSKPMTAIAVMQLVEEGIIDLDTPIVEYMPAFSQLPSVLGEGDYTNITARMLLTHTSGILANFIGYKSATLNAHSPAYMQYFLDRLAANAMMSAENYAFSYNNNGFVLLGILVAYLTGDGNFFYDFEAYAHENIFAPMGMTHTSFIQSEALIPYMARPYDVENNQTDLVFMNWSPTGGAISNARDMARFMHFILGRGEFEGTRVLSQNTVNQMLTRHDFDFSLAPAGLGYGLGFMNAIAMDGTIDIGHGGNVIHYHTGMRFDLDTSLGVFVSTNSASALPAAGAMTSAILQAAVTEKAGNVNIVLPVLADADAYEIEMSAEELEALEGLYLGLHEYYVIQVIDGELNMIIPIIVDQLPSIPLTPMSDGSFDSMIGRIWFANVNGTDVLKMGDFGFHIMAFKADNMEYFIAPEHFINYEIGTFEARPIEGEVTFVTHLVFGVDALGFATMQSVNAHGFSPVMPVPAADPTWDSFEGAEPIYEVDEDGVLISFRILGMDFVRVD
ncbi:MAG: serine hydrolase [Firmicutes bacterium]|nr:serine hydrolase [Bacillota bacterium]